MSVSNLHSKQNWPGWVELGAVEGVPAGGTGWFEGPF